MRRSLAVFLLAIFLVAPSVAAVPPEAPHRHETFCSVPLWLDPPSPNVNPADLSAFVNNQPVKIVKLLEPDSDLVILMVLDLTGDLSLVQPAKESLAAELKKLPSNAWVGLLSAQGGLSVLSDPTGDRATIASLIQSFPISGKAGLLDTLEPVATLADDLLHKAAVRVAVLYITDSDVTNYREDLTNPVINSSDPHDLSRRFPDALIRERGSRLQRQLAYTSAPVFILHLQYHANGLNQSYQSVLGTLAETTAGFATFCRSAGSIPTEIASMISYIRSSFFLKLALPSKAASVWQVRLEWKNTPTPEPNLAYRARISVKRR
jgi:hypothetical protein